METIKEIRENIDFSTLWQFSQNCNEDQIVDNLLPIFVLKKRQEQSIRDLSGEILSRLSPERLVVCYKSVVELIRSPYAFVRNEAEGLLNKIDPKLLFSYFDYLMALQEDADYGIKRFAKATVLKIATNWPLKEKQLHSRLILEWQKSKDEKEVAVGNLLALQVMQFWRTKNLEPFMPFLVACSDLIDNDIETVETAVALAFKFLSQANLDLRLQYLDYMANFNDYAISEIRRGFRHLALETIEAANLGDNSKYALFFLRCLEGKNKIDRTMAWKKLLLIDPNKLPVCYLVYCQVSGLYRVRRAGKKLARRVDANVLINNLEEFLNLQDSDCYEVRHLAEQLIMRIPLVKMKEKKEVLERYSKYKFSRGSDLAKYCLAFC